MDDLDHVGEKKLEESSKEEAIAYFDEAERKILEEPREQWDRTTGIRDLSAMIISMGIAFAGFAAEFPPILYIGAAASVISSIVVTKDLVTSFKMETKLVRDVFKDKKEKSAKKHLTQPDLGHKSTIHPQHSFEGSTSTGLKQEDQRDAEAVLAHLTNALHDPKTAAQVHELLGKLSAGNVKNESLADVTQPDASQTTTIKKIMGFNQLKA